MQSRRCCKTDHWFSVLGCACGSPGRSVPRVFAVFLGSELVVGSDCPRHTSLQCSVPEPQRRSVTRIQTPVNIWRLLGRKGGLPAGAPLPPFSRFFCLSSRRSAQSWRRVFPWQRLSPAVDGAWQTLVLTHLWVLFTCPRLTLDQRLLHPPQDARVRPSRVLELKGQSSGEGPGYLLAAVLLLPLSGRAADGQCWAYWHCDSCGAGVPADIKDVTHCHQPPPDCASW